MSARRRERPGSAPVRRSSRSIPGSSPKQLTPLSQKSLGRIRNAPHKNGSPPFEPPARPNYSQSTSSSKGKEQVGRYV